MEHFLANSDREFKRQVEACEFPVSEFDHRAHLRLAYIYLVEDTVEVAVQRMRAALLALLEAAGIDPSSKFHETLTRAWVLAVDHFMHKARLAKSADEFIDGNPQMLDSRIMLTHYPAETLFSDQARRKFLEPTLDPIPRHRV